MRKLGIVLTPILILVLIIVAIGCGSEEVTSAPKETVREYLEALEAMDANSMANFCTGEARVDALSYADLFAAADKTEISSIRIEVVSQSETEATVEYECDIEITVQNEMGGYYEQDTMHLVREGDRWLIDTIGRTVTDAYEIDQEVIQLATATFYADVHAGWGGGADGNIATYSDNVWGASNAAYSEYTGHYYPTAITGVSNHILTHSGTNFDPDNENNPRIDGTNGAATNSEINDHAIWMGLLVNAGGEYDSETGTTDRRYVSPLSGEPGPYLNEFPESASTMNGKPSPEGSYTWIVGIHGRVYGAYKGGDGYWYHGFSGEYP